MSCPSQTGREPAVYPVEAPGDIVLFFTGQELGALKPCGCSGGQLGGLSKRPAVFNQVPASRRMLIDTGLLVAGDGEQDLIKFGVIFEAYRLLGYDLVHLSGQDIEIGQGLDLLNEQRYPFAMISGAWGPAQDDRPRSFRKSFEVDGQAVSVNVVGFDAEIDAAEQASAFFSGLPEGNNINVLILENGGTESRQAWAEQSGAHCVLCPADSDEPQVLGDSEDLPLVFTVGRFGRHIVRLDVDIHNSIPGIDLRFSDVAVEETLPEDEALARLYRQYQQLVAESRLLERYPRIPLADGLQYVGSKHCASCHEYEYTKWSTKAHADAFATLVEVGSDRDPECVVCHVIGMERSSGFVSKEKTPELKDVGCENCHGPASEHIRTRGTTAPGEPRSTCLDCHTPEHSSGYAGHEAEFRQKIMHWREP